MGACRYEWSWSLSVRGERSRAPTLVAQSRTELHDCLRMAGAEGPHALAESSARLRHRPLGSNPPMPAIHLHCRLGSGIPTGDRSLRSLSSTDPRSGQCPSQTGCRSPLSPLPYAPGRHGRSIPLAARSAGCPMRIAHRHPTSYSSRLDSGLDRHCIGDHLARLPGRALGCRRQGHA